MSPGARRPPESGPPADPSGSSPSQPAEGRGEGARAGKGDSARVRRGRRQPWTVREVVDEREPLADGALRLIEEAFERRDRQPLSELRSEIAEKRLGLLTAMDFHLLVAESPDGEALGTITGMYLEGVNAGFITYLTVAPEWRRRRLGPALRGALVETFRQDARRAGFDDLAWVLGEVRAGSPWLKRLVRSRGALTFDLAYYHPGMTPGGDSRRYILYRQPVGDPRDALAVPLVRRILYSIYRRGYRVRYPLERPGFQAMLDQLEGREEVGAHPDFPPGGDGPEATGQGSSAHH